VLDDAVLFVRKHSVNPKIILQHHQILNTKGKFYYPLRSHEIRSFNISTGTQSISSETLFRAILPEFLIVTFVDSEAFSGKLSKGCFSFQPFGLQSISCSLDGESTLYRQLDFNTQDSLALMGYNTLFSAINDQEYGTTVTRDDYLNGAFFVVLDLRPSTSGLNLQGLRKGQIHIDLKFSKALTSAITCLVVGTFQSLLTIDSNSNVTYDTFGA